MMLSKIFDQLDERVMKVDVDTSPLPLVVTEQPTRNDVRRLVSSSKSKEVRGILDMDKDRMYIWDAYFANHMQIANAIGVSFYNEVVFVPPLSEAGIEKIADDHGSTVAFVGPEFAMLGRDIPNLRMFNCIANIFNGDGPIRKLRF